MTRTAMTFEEAHEHLIRLQHRATILRRLQMVLRERFKAWDGQPPLEFITDASGGNVKARTEVVNQIEYELGDALSEAIDQINGLRQMKFRRSTFPRGSRSLESA